MPYSIRHHQKSRKGCNGCKVRRVKCNEAKPQCAGCIRRGVECIYAGNAPSSRQATRSPTLPIPSSSDDPGDVQPTTTCLERQPSDGPHYSTKHLLDLRLMHHYCLFTAQFFARTFPEQVRVAFQEHIPRLAFKNAFLMDAILLVSMIHLGSTDPVSLESLPIYLYRGQALRTLREAIVDVSPQTMHAVLGASLLHTTVSFATDRVTRQPGLWIANWLTLVLGQRNFRSSGFVFPAQSGDLSPGGLNDMQSPNSQYGSFTDLPDSVHGIIATDIQRALAQEEERYNGTWTDGDVLRRAASELGRLIAVLEYPREDSWLEKKIKAWSFDIVPLEFVELVRQARPPALVILAYYITFLQFLPDSWLYEGVASHDLEEIGNMIDTSWEKYLEVPKTALQTTSRTALARVLVSSLPQHDNTRARGL